MSINDLKISLSSFYRFSPTTKFIRVDSVAFPCSSILKLVRSLPLLEDLTLIGNSLLRGNDDELHASHSATPSTSPVFTGSPEITLYSGMGITVRRLLDLPNGLRFRKLDLMWVQGEDLRWVVELVVKCSHTLECIDATCFHPGMLVFVPR